MQSHLEWERLWYSDIGQSPFVSSSSQLKIILCQTSEYTPVTLKALGVSPVELVAYQFAVRLSPFAESHFNMLGRYSFSMPDEVKMDKLRPLRDPENP